jgi:hypothetical protein
MLKHISALTVGIYLGQEIKDIPKIKPIFDKVIKDTKQYLDNIDKKNN